jgi:transcriptional regulator with XRE-family HTH domain
MVDLSHAPAPAARGDSFGSLLKDWRRRRGASQLELALRTGVSQRHISFVESGRSRPSRDMVSVLATALDVPLRQQNALLMAAGFAPVWRESDLKAPELGQVKTALDRMLAQQEPYPAIVVDRLWNLLDANTAAQRLTGSLIAHARMSPPEGQPNLLRMLLAPNALRPVIGNWSEVAQSLVQATYAEVMAAGGDAPAMRFLDELMSYPDVSRFLRKVNAGDRPLPVLPVDFRLPGRVVRVFTVIATLGTPQDIALQEVRVESFFPADDASEAYFRAQATDH